VGAIDVIRTVSNSRPADERMSAEIHRRRLAANAAWWDGFASACVVIGAAFVLTWFGLVSFLG
jgi:hypothetical protein